MQQFANNFLSNIYYPAMEMFAFSFYLAADEKKNICA